jgi:selenocysteine lyase/cysteine desulfurase
MALSRRSFLSAAAGAAGASALARFAEGGVERVLAVAGATGAASAEDLAADESFWREIQQAFTVDRSLVNLNNGGVSPSPRVVQDALRRYLEMSNQAPTHYMWSVLEPEIETVRKDKLPRLWPLMAAPAEMSANVRKFEEIGTHAAANHNAISEALTFHEGIGVERKAARLRYLRARFEDRLRDRDGVRLRTPRDPRQSCGLANLALEGVDPGKLASFLWDKHRIIVTPLGHEECRGIRVTPSVYTTLDEIDRFSEALDGVLQDGLPS